MKKSSPRLYLDTGALVKLYLVEPGSEFVQHIASTASCIPLNPLQETELRTAVFAAQGRGVISEQATIQTLNNFDEDVAEGFLQREVPEWPEVWTRAGDLAGRHAAAFLCRTLDILHVAIAEQSAIDILVSGDNRQIKLAKAVGLNVASIP